LIFNLGHEQDAGQPAVSPEKMCLAYKTKHPGNSSIAIRDDGKICAVGGWDGKIRLYSTKTLKPLGTLNYHKDGCQIVVFARSLPHTASPADAGKSVLSDDEESDDEEEMNERERKARTRWLASGGKDHRVSIWSLMSFDNSGT